MDFSDTSNNGGAQVNKDEIPAAVKVNKHWDKPVQSERNFIIFLIFKRACWIYPSRRSH